MWRELWPVIGDEITLLFTKSLESGKVPREWKIAKIVPLQKPKKKDYTVVNNYRPISLLPTLGKALESLVAETISYLVEEHSLLPKTHFGARKQRSTTHALSYLYKDVFKAWRGKKTMSLVSFDISTTTWRRSRKSRDCGSDRSARRLSDGYRTSVRTAERV